MFNEVITATAMTSGATNAFFAGVIDGQCYNGDCSFLSTLRALLGPRIHDAHLMFYVMDLTISRQNYGADRIGNTMDYIARDFGEENSLTLVRLASDQETNSLAFSCIEEHFADPDNTNGRGYVRLKQITDFFRANFKVLCFVNERKRSSILFVEGLNLRKYHQLQIASLTVLPWFFNPQTDARPTDLEMELLRSLQEKTSEKYRAVLEQIAAAGDFEGRFLREALDKIESRQYESRAKSLDDEIQRIHIEINQLQSKIDNYCSTISEKTMMLMGLRAQIANRESDHTLRDYFSCNRSLRLDSVTSDTILRYHVNTYMTYFDADASEIYLNNKYSEFYCETVGTGYSEKEIKRFFTHIFVDETIRVRMCSAYKLDVRGGFGGISSYDYGADGIDRMPNPHIDHYSCLGNYARRINERIEQSDFIGALESSVASAMSVNVADGTVLRAFVRDIFSGRGGRCYVLQDGTQLDITEVMDEIRKEIKAEEAANE